jgi:phospho-N-acetylmuramoyl-pentapeptide-transferase
MMILPLGGALVGFIDDWLKFSRSSSEGLSSWHKLICQVAIVVPWALWVQFSVGIFLFPGLKLGTVAGSGLLVFLSVGFLNAVNITDGLDGLAAGCSLISFAAALLWLGPEIFPLCVIGLGITGGFLWHNCHPAKVFMGDVGAHFLGGILISIAIWSHYLAALFPLAFMFGIETLSVILQLTSLKLRKKRLFRMSPIHHHFELVGWSEPQVVARFWLIHASGLALLAFMLETFQRWF